MSNLTSSNAVGRNTEIAINWINKNDKDEKPAILPAKVPPGLFDENGNIDKSKLGKAVPCIQMPGAIWSDGDGDNSFKFPPVTMPGDINISDILDKNKPKSIDDQIKEKEKELESLKKQKEKQEAQAESILEKIKGILAQGGDPSSILDKIKELGIGLPWLQLPKKPENPEGFKPVAINLPGFVKEPAEGLKPEDIDPGFTIDPPKTDEIEGIKPENIGDIPKQKAPEKRSSNGLNLADAYKIMDYIHDKHRVKDKNGSYIDLTNLSPAEQNLYNQAVRAANELNPRSMIYDTTGLDTSKADELIKKFEEENS